MVECSCNCPENLSSGSCAATGQNTPVTTFNTAKIVLVMYTSDGSVVRSVLQQRRPLSSRGCDKEMSTSWADVYLTGSSS